MQNVAFKPLTLVISWWCSSAALLQKHWRLSLQCCCCPDCIYRPNTFLFHARRCTCTHHTCRQNKSDTFRERKGEFHKVSHHCVPIIHDLSPQSSQRAVGKKGLPKSNDSLIADIIKGQAIRRKQTGKRKTFENRWN